MDVIALVVGTVVWLSLLAVRAIDLQPATTSRYELERRAGEGDSAAEAALRRENNLHRVASLRQFSQLLLLVVATALAIYLFGWLLGATITVLIGLQLDWLSTRTFIYKLANRYYKPREPVLIDRVGKWRFLDWFAPRRNTTSEHQLGSKDELVHLLESSHGVLSREEVAGIKSLVAFGAKQVGDIMTPRSMIDAIAATESVGPLVIDDLHQTGHSRFPVYDPDLDHVVGILMLRDLVELKTKNKTAHGSMEQRVFYINEKHTLKQALHGFLRTRHHLFIVVNQYRETVGLISLEDVIEALLGRKIVDEFDAHDDLRQVAAANPYGNNQPQDRIDV